MKNPANNTLIVIVLLVAAFLTCVLINHIENMSPAAHPVTTQA